MNLKAVKNIKSAIREWFGVLSISEIIHNPNLSRTFERIEKIIYQLEINAGQNV